MTATKKSASYTGKRHALYTHGVWLTSLGWDVGMATRDKHLIAELFPDENGLRQALRTDEFEAISIILDENLLVVDIDDRSWVPPDVLPTTLKERTPKGVHLYYHLPDGDYRCDIKTTWDGVDLLVFEDEAPDYCGRSSYDDEEGTEWESHVLCAPSDGYVLCAPSDGYRLVYPNEWVHRNEITPAPPWLVEKVSA